MSEIKKLELIKKVEATLVSLGTTELYLKNEKKTPYYVSTVQFINSKGVSVKTSAMVYKAVVYDKNGEQRVNVGSTYTTELFRGTDRVLAVLSPFSNDILLEKDL